MCYGNYRSGMTSFLTLLKSMQTTVFSTTTVSAATSLPPSLTWERTSLSPQAQQPTIRPMWRAGTMRSKSTTTTPINAVVFAAIILRYGQPFTHCSGQMLTIKALKFLVMCTRHREMHTRTLE